jgi:hypothetical protein
MIQQLQRLFTLLQPWLARMHRLAIGGAWFFAIASMIPLIWLMLEGGAEGSSRVFGVTIESVTHTVWGLTYAGFFGGLLLWMELLAVGAAMLLTILPVHTRFADPAFLTRLRRIGHGYLTGWAGLWMIGVMYLASLASGFWVLQAIFIAFLFGCTVYRAAFEWSPPQSAPGQPIQIDVAAAEDNAHATDFIARNRLEVI